MELTAGKIDLIIPGAFHVDSPAMRFDDTLGQCQPQTGSATFEACLAGGMFAQLAGLVEFGKDDLAEGRVHSHAGVADDDLDCAVGKVHNGRDVMTGNGDLSVVGCEFDCIANDVVE